jgi:hypothetical protein
MPKSNVLLQRNGQQQQKWQPNVPKHNVQQQPPLAQP